MILLTTSEESKIIIKIKDISSIYEKGKTTHIKVKGIEEKVIVLESIDDIRFMLQSSNKFVVGLGETKKAKVINLAAEN